MVEFVRDVIIAVALFATLIAVAAHASADAEPNRLGSALGTAVAATLARSAVVQGAPAAQSQSMAVQR